MPAPAALTQRSLTIEDDQIVDLDDYLDHHGRAGLIPSSAPPVPLG